MTPTTQTVPTSWGQFVPDAGTKLTDPDGALDEATYAAMRIEQVERHRGLSAPDARAAAARRARVSPGTLEKLVKRRLKQVATHVHARLREALVGILTEEKQRLAHELELARRSPVGVDADALRQAELALETARRALRGENA